MHSDLETLSRGTGATQRIQAPTPALRCLWITWTHPFPERDGQRLYTGRMIDAVAAAGGSIDVLCFASEEPERVPPETNVAVRWHTVPRESRPSWLSPLLPLPNLANRCATLAMRQQLDRLLREGCWNTIVLDGLSAAWALPAIERLPMQRRPRLVHISHNHEASLRDMVARDFRGNPLKRLALKRDAEKCRRLEDRVILAADLATAITEEDAARYRESHLGREFLVLPPGYAGEHVAERRIDHTLPRRAVIVGSFHWVAKKMNLEAFLAAADPLFAEAGAELQVVGSGDPNFLESLRRRLRATEIVGAVDDVRPYLREARAAVVPERTGGGFKLKILDYVFSRVPVLAMRGSTAGTPLQSPQSVRLYDDLDSLAHGTLELLDDVATADRMQDAAYEACRDGFDWRQRGRLLLAEMAAV